MVKNHEMVGFVRDHLKTQNISKNAVNKNIKMCDKVIIENTGTLGFIPEFYKDQKCVICVIFV